jgi:aspartokinase-like uncharacterized kinase
MAVPLVVKVGGSLYDLPDLSPRLRRWLADHAPRATIVVPGGGPPTNAVRDLDRIHHLGEETSHWLALRALSLNARLLRALLGRAEVAWSVPQCRRRWTAGAVPIISPWEFCRGDDRRPGALPHTWAVTSDSVAARVAVVAGAEELVLLKSAPQPAGDVAVWAETGYVDPWLPRVLAGSGVPVRAVDLRGGG